MCDGESLGGIEMKKFLSVFLFTSLLLACKDQLTEDRKLTKEKVSLEFDVNTITCVKSDGSTVAPSLMEDGIELTFTAKLNANERVKEWLLNYAKIDGQTSNTLKLKINIKKAITQGNKKIIKIAFNKETTEKEKVSLEFDVNTITCVKSDGSTVPPSLVEDGIELTFTAKLSVNEKVKEWLLNDIKIDEQTSSTLNLKIDVKKAITQGNKKIIKIAFNKEENKQDILIKFDKNKCHVYKKGNEIEPDSKVEENEKLSFVMKPQRGKNIKKWTINGVEKEDATTVSFGYVVAKQDVVNGAITIDYTTSDIKSYVVNFDPSKVECKANSGNIPIRNGENIYEREGLTFTAILAQGDEVQNWFVKDDEQKFATFKSFFYIVADKDSEDVGGKPTIKVSYKIKPFITIKFEDQIEKCVRRAYDGEKVLQSGDKVPSGASLTFTAKLEEGEKVAKWLVNSKPQANQTAQTFYYKVLEADADSEKVIKVTFEKVTLQKAILKFDATKLNCTKNSVAFASDQTIYEGDNLSFTAILKEGFKVVNWKVGDSDKTNQTFQYFYYKVSMSDAKVEGTEKIIRVSYVETELPKHHISFDSTKATCKKIKGDQEVTDDMEVHEGITLTFTATEGDKLEIWSINDEIVTYAKTPTFTYTVASKDAKEVGGKSTIKISYSLKTKLKIKFDENAMTAKKSVVPVTDLHNGEEVDSLVVIYFTAKLEEGKTVDKWKVNDNEIVSPTPSVFYYTALSKDGKDTGNEVTISYTKKDIPKYHINFESDKMTCTRGSEEISNDTEVFEGTILKFTAKAEASDILGWYVKDIVVQASNGKKTFSYIVKEKDSEDISGNKTIRVKYTVKEKIKIIFDSETISCRYDGLSNEPINSGDMISPSEWILFTAILKDGQSVVAWKRNGVAINGATGKTYSYLVKQLDSVTENGIKQITMSVEVK